MLKDIFNKSKQILKSLPVFVIEFISLLRISAFGCLKESVKIN